MQQTVQHPFYGGGWGGRRGPGWGGGGWGGGPGWRGWGWGGPWGGYRRRPYYGRPIGCCCPVVLLAMLLACATLLTAPLAVFRLTRARATHTSRAG